PALHHVGDVAIALAVEADRGHHLGQELARAAHERQPLLVFLLAGALPHHHEPRPRTARAERDVRAALAELAELAALARALLLGQRVGGIGERYPGKREIAQAQIAVVPERVGQPAQGQGHGLPRVAHRASGWRGWRRESDRSRAARPRGREWRRPPRACSSWADPWRRPSDRAG